MAKSVQDSDLPEGSEGTTTPPASPGAGDEPNSQAAADQLVNAVLERLESSIEERVQKAVQSTKDKRFNEVEDFTTTYGPLLKRVKDLIPAEDYDRIQRDLEMEDLRSIVNTLQRGQGNTGNVTPAPPVDVAKLVGDSGLDPRDPQVIMMMNRKFDSALEAKAAIADILISKNSAPTPTPAQSPASNTGEPTPNNDTAESLMAEYKKAVAPYRGNIQKVSELQASFRRKAAEKGVDLQL